MKTRQWHTGVLAVVALLAVFSGCAERVATTQPSAPAPTGPVAAPPADQPATQEQPTAAPPRPPASEPAAPAPPPARVTAAAPPAPAPTQKGEVTTQKEATTQKKEEEFTEQPALKDVFFERGRTEISRTGAEIVRDNARWLLEHQGYLVLIEGHTDHWGTREVNLIIGERRARAARAFLIKEGVPQTRLRTVSYGSERPVCAEKTEACAAKNRRVHFLVKPQ